MSESMQNIQGKPNGGFPPIYICDKIPIQLKPSGDELKKREYETHQTSISLKSILDKRRHKMHLNKLIH